MIDRAFSPSVIPKLLGSTESLLLHCKCIVSSQKWLVRMRLPVSIRFGGLKHLPSYKEIRMGKRDFSSMWKPCAGALLAFLSLQPLFEHGVVAHSLERPSGTFLWMPQWIGTYNFGNASLVLQQNCLSAYGLWNTWSCAEKYKERFVVSASLLESLPWKVQMKKDW